MGSIPEEIYLESKVHSRSPKRPDRL
jgi:hypothetical protein